MRILYVCHRIPYPPDKGDKIRSFHQVEYLARRHPVDLFTFVDDPADEAHVEPLRRKVRRLHWERLRPAAARGRAALALLRGRSLSEGWFSSAALASSIRGACERERYDVAVAFSSTMGGYVAGRGIPCALDFVDVDSAKFEAYSRQAPALSPRRAVYGREARALRALEKRLAEAADATLVCSRREADALAAFSAPRRLEVLHNGTDADYFAPGAPDSRRAGDVVFTGAMDYPANVDAVCWFATEAWPRVKRAFPGARLSIVGSNPAPAVRALAAPDVEVTGRVDDVRPFLHRAAVAVAPLRVARGIQNKVLEALSCGLPVVATRAALGGLCDEGPVAGAIAADGAEEFADATVRLLSAPAESRRLGGEGREFVRKNWRWEQRLARFEAILAELAAPASSLRASGSEKAD